jgi:hypothetical protein
MKARSVLRLLVTTNVSSSAILVALMMEAICSSETSVLTRATQSNIQEDRFLNFYALKIPSAVVMNNPHLWNIVPRGLVTGNLRFGGTYRFHIQG